MADSRALRALKAGGSTWSTYRQENTDIDLSEPDLRRADLRGADLDGADLTGAYLEGANLFEADLSWADLDGADLYGAKLGGAKLGGAKLSGANLNRADLTSADLREADLRGAKLGGADLTRADLTMAKLSDADLTRAKLSDAELGEADLTSADLSWADLSEANLTKANLTKANLTAANLTRVNLDKVKWNPEYPPTWPEGFDPPESSEDDEPPPPEDISDADPGPAAGIAVLPLERSREYPDEQSRQVVLGAVESILRELAPYRDPETTPLDPDEWAGLDTSCTTLESQLRHPRGGNPTIIAAATDDAIRAARPHLDLDNVDPEVSELLTTAEGIGDPDPAEAGHHAESVIDHVTEHPPASTTQPPPPIGTPADEPGDEPTDPADTKHYIDRAKEAAQEGSLRGIDSGVEDLIKSLIVGSPAAIAAATKVLAGWMVAGTHGAAAGVAWAVIRIVIGSFKNRNPPPAD